MAPRKVAKSNASRASKAIGARPRRTTRRSSHSPSGSKSCNNSGSSDVFESIKKTVPKTHPAYKLFVKLFDEMLIVMKDNFGSLVRFLDQICKKDEKLSMRQIVEWLEDQGFEYVNSHSRARDGYLTRRQPKVPGATLMPSTTDSTAAASGHRSQSHDASGQSVHGIPQTPRESPVAPPASIVRLTSQTPIVQGQEVISQQLACTASNDGTVPGQLLDKENEGEPEVHIEETSLKEISLVPVPSTSAQSDGQSQDFYQSTSPGQPIYKSYDAAFPKKSTHPVIPHLSNSNGQQHRRPSREEEEPQAQFSPCPSPRNNPNDHQSTKSLETLSAKALKKDRRKSRRARKLPATPESSNDGFSPELMINYEESESKTDSHDIRSRKGRKPNSANPTLTSLRSNQLELALSLQKASDLAPIPKKNTFDVLIKLGNIREQKIKFQRTGKGQPFVTSKGSRRPGQPSTSKSVGSQAKPSKFPKRLTSATKPKEKRTADGGFSRKNLRFLKKHFERNPVNELYCPMANCKYYGKAFTNDEALKKHFCTLHKTGEKKYRCVWVLNNGLHCHMEFSTRDNLRDHIKMHETENLFPCPCDPCPERMPTREDVDLHVQANHEGSFHALRITREKQALGNVSSNEEIVDNGDGESMLGGDWAIGTDDERYAD